MLLITFSGTWTSFVQPPIPEGEFSGVRLEGEVTGEPRLLLRVGARPRRTGGGRRHSIERTSDSGSLTPSAHWTEDGNLK